MDKKVITFGKAERKTRNFHNYKNSISIYNVDINIIYYLTNFF